MAGGTIRHGRISGNIFREVDSKLRLKKSSCSSFNSDIKLHLEKGNRFVYPDMMVVCGKEMLSSTYKEAITNPTVIIEVLSESTANYDRGDKFYFYRQIKSLREYILIEQDKAQIEIFSRVEANFWKIDRIEGLESKLNISSVGVEVDLKEIYLNVEFDS
jgi:Uma2 family endonuclease